MLVTLTLVRERAKYMSIVTGEPAPSPTPCSASKPGPGPLIGARSDEEDSSALFWTWNTLPVQALDGAASDDLPVEGPFSPCDPFRLHFLMRRELNPSITTSSTRQSTNIPPFPCLLQSGQCKRPHRGP